MVPTSARRRIVIKMLIDYSTGWVDTRRRIEKKTTSQSSDKCHGTTSLPLLHPPLAASNPIHLLSMPSASSLCLPPPLCAFHLHSAPTPNHTSKTCTTTLHPLLH